MIDWTTGPPIVRRLQILNGLETHEGGYDRIHAFSIQGWGEPSPE